MKSQLNIFYGSLITKNDYENLVHFYKMNNLYSLIYKNNLQIMDVGEVGKSWSYVVGKEIYIDYNNLLELNNNLINKETNMILTDDEKVDIRNKLIKLNINKSPNYYIFSTFQ